jgi:hypothetical protein
MSRRTFDLRIWIDCEAPWLAAMCFLDDARELAAELHPDVEVRWVAEARRRRPSVQPDADASEES